MANYSECPMAGWAGAMVDAGSCLDIDEQGNIAEDKPALRYQGKDKEKEEEEEEEGKRRRDPTRPPPYYRTIRDMAHIIDDLEPKPRFGKLWWPRLRRSWIKQLLIVPMGTFVPVLAALGWVVLRFLSLDRLLPYMVCEFPAQQTYNTRLLCVSDPPSPPPYVMTYSSLHRPIHPDYHSHCDFYWSWNQVQALRKVAWLSRTVSAALFGPGIDRNGGKAYLVRGGLAASVLVLVTPLLARFSYIRFLIAHAIVNLYIGPMLPATMALLARWSPQRNRTFITFIALITFGHDSWSWTGLLDDQLADWLFDGMVRWTGVGGWVYACYLSGLLTLSWVLLVRWLLEDAPKDHPYISDLERSYLAKRSGSARLPVTYTPWESIVTSRVFLVNLFMSGFLSFLGSHLALVLNLYDHVRLISVGPLDPSSEYVRMLVHVGVGSLCAILIDAVLLRSASNMSFVRKVFCIASLWGLLGFNLAMSQGSCISLGDKRCSPVLMVYAMGLAVSSVIGQCYLYVTFLDSGPTFAAAQTSLFVLVSELCSLASTAFVTEYFFKADVELADTVSTFYTLLCIVGIISCLLTILFGSADLQPWNLSTQIPFDMDAAHKIRYSFFVLSRP